MATNSLTERSLKMKFDTMIAGVEGKVKFTLSGVGLIFLFGCSSPEFSEVSRLKSPDGSVEIVVGVLETDATVSKTTELRIESPGDINQKIFVVSRFYKEKFYKIKWESPEKLFIKTKGATHFIESSVYCIKYKNACKNIYVEILSEQ